MLEKQLFEIYENKDSILFVLKMWAVLLFFITVVLVFVYYHEKQSILDFIYKDRELKKLEKQYAREEKLREEKERIKYERYKDAVKNARPGKRPQTTMLVFNPFTLKEEALPESFAMLGLDYFPDNKNDLKKYYRKLAKKYHPDKPEGSADKFKELQVYYKDAQEIIDIYKEDPL